MRAIRSLIFPLHCGIAPVRLEDLVGSAAIDMKMERLPSDRGAGSVWDLMALSTLAAALRPRTCFEIGTGKGRATLHLGLNTGADVTIHTIDRSVHPSVGSVFRGHPVERKIVRHAADSRSFDFTPWAGSVDFVFVDGGHDEACVKHDTEVAFSLVSSTGAIVWDDFTPSWPGVVRALARSPRREAIRRILGTKLCVSVPGLPESAP